MRLALILCFCALLGACSTQRPLPQAAADRAATELIIAIWSGQRAEQPDQPLMLRETELFKGRSAEVNRLIVQMENRQPELKSLLDGGQIGLTRDGYLEQHETGALDLDTRDHIRDLVARENADRAALYRELAVLNRQPHWQSPLALVFGRRYLDQAAPGWWFRDGSNVWQQKWVDAGQ